MRKYTISFCILAVSFFLTCVNSYALVIGPARLETRLPAGEVTVIDYYAQNDTEGTMHVVVEPENWGAYAHGYKDLPVKSWITLDTYEFDLKPREIKKIKLKVRTPTNVKGEVAVQVYFSSVVVEAGATPETGIRSRLGAVLYVAIKGTETPEAKIKDVAVSKLLKDGKESLNIMISVANSGNVHILPASMEALIKNEKGVEIKKLDLPCGKSMLPCQTNTYSVSWDVPELKAGMYTVEIIMKYGKMYTKEKTALSRKRFEVNNSGEVITK